MITPFRSCFLFVWIFGNQNRPSSIFNRIISLFSPLRDSVYSHIGWSILTRHIQKLKLRYFECFRTEKSKNNGNPFRFPWNALTFCKWRPICGCVGEVRRNLDKKHAILNRKHYLFYCGNSHGPRTYFSTGWYHPQTCQWCKTTLLRHHHGGYQRQYTEPVENASTTQESPAQCRWRNKNLRTTVNWLLCNSNIRTTVNWSEEITLWKKKIFESKKNNYLWEWGGCWVNIINWSEKGITSPASRDCKLTTHGEFSHDLGVIRGGAVVKPVWQDFCLKKNLVWQL